MDDNTAKVLLATIPAAISAIVAWTLSRRSVTNFYAQRWWERKADAYSAALKSLSVMSFTEMEWLKKLSGEVTLSPDYSAKLDDQMREAMEVLKLFRGTQGFLISAPAAQAIHTVIQNLESPAQDASYDTCVANLEAIEACKKRIIEAARTDLKLDRSG